MLRHCLITLLLALSVLLSVAPSDSGGAMTDQATITQISLDDLEGDPVLLHALPSLPPAFWPQDTAISPDRAYHSPLLATLLRPPIRLS